jgi:hypothetical protein
MCIWLCVYVRACAGVDVCVDMYVCPSDVSVSVFLRVCVCVCVCVLIRGLAGYVLMTACTVSTSVYVTSMLEDTPD